MASAGWPLFWWLVESICIPLSLPWIILRMYHSNKTHAKLRGKVVVITGASSGLGEALAHAFYKAGCKVILVARRERELTRVKNDLLSLHPVESYGTGGGNSKRKLNEEGERFLELLKPQFIPLNNPGDNDAGYLTEEYHISSGILLDENALTYGETETIPTYPPVTVPIDLAELNDIPGQVARILAVHSKVDILINNAGISYRGDIVSTKVDVDIKVMLINYFGQIALTKALLPSMVECKSGHIVAVSSVQGRLAIPYRSAYAASKHALQAFCDTLRAEVACHDIKVTVVSPGYIRTNLSLNAITGSGQQYGVLDETTASGYPPEKVAEQILNVVAEEKPESVICPITHRLAIIIRTLCPPLYFFIMKRRAKGIADGKVT